MSLVWSLVAAFCAVLSEYLYRRLTGDWWSYLWIWLPLSGCISYCRCQLVRAPGMPLIGALLIWTLCIMGLRILVTLVLLKDHVSHGTWAAITLLLIGRVLMATWK